MDQPGRYLGVGGLGPYFASNRKPSLRNSLVGSNDGYSFEVPIWHLKRPGPHSGQTEGSGFPGRLVSPFSDELIRQGRTFQKGLVPYGLEERFQPITEA